MPRERASAFAPGRVNLIGEFTDYNDGLALPFAITEGVTVRAEAIATGRVEAPPDRRPLARICSRVENDWVGAQTGLLDQLSSLYGERDAALRIDFRSLDIRSVALDLAGWRLVTLDSGERHANAASGYNRRRAECAQACEELGIESLRDATLAMADALPDPLRGRVRHVVS